MTPVTVVIVNFNGGHTILRCLDALSALIDQSSILIVDNASTDGSIRTIYTTFPRIRLLPLRRNVGFARAVNIAAARIDHNGVMITLNPDTLPEPGFIDGLIQPLIDDLSIGSVGGTLVFSSDPSTIASAGISIHRNGVALDAKLGERLDRDCPTIRPIFGASGGAAAYRLSAFRDVGGMCDAFFLYLEDVDLAWRLRLRGWNSVQAQAAVASHDYSASSGEGSPFKRRLLARNRIWTLARCLPSEIWRRDRAAILAFDMLAAGHGTITLDPASLRGRASGIIGMPFRLLEREAIQSRTTVDFASIDEWIQPAVTPRKLLELRALTRQLARPTGN